MPKSDIYDRFEPLLNAGAVELLDVPELQEQLLTLVLRGAKIAHQPGDQDDYANAAAGVIALAAGMGASFQGVINFLGRLGREPGHKITEEMLVGPMPRELPTDLFGLQPAAKVPAPLVTLHAKPFALFQVEKSRY